MGLREQLFAAARGKVVVMGIGNVCRGDDAAGSFLARRICDGPGVHVIDAQDVPEDYLCQVARLCPDTVVMIDSVDLGSKPGSVALVDQNCTLDYWPSTHRVPMSLLVDYLARTTQAHVFLMAIQPRQTGFLQPMSAEVSSSVEGLADLLNDVLALRGALAGAEPASLRKGRVSA